MPAISFIEWWNISTFRDTGKKRINFVRRYFDILEKSGHFSQKSGKGWTYWKKLDILLKRVEKSNGGHFEVYERLRHRTPHNFDSSLPLPLLPFHLTVTSIPYSEVLPCLGRSYHFGNIRKLNIFITEMNLFIPENASLSFGRTSAGTSWYFWGKVYRLIFCEVNV